MNMKPHIVIDIDNTIVDTGKYWLDSLIGDPRVQLNGVDPLPYNLSELAHPKHEHDVFIEWWGREDIYDHMEPRPGAVHAVRRLLEADFEVSFCSFVVGCHWESKRDFIHRFFPRGIDVILTSTLKGKQKIAGDVHIDDRAENLIHRPQSNALVYYETPYHDPQAADFERNSVFRTSSWEDITRYCTSLRPHLL